MTDRPRLSDLKQPAFSHRHIGPTSDELQRMLDAIGSYANPDALMDAALPESIRETLRASLPAAASEAESLAELAELAEQNTRAVSMIGQGYYGTHTPAVIRRNVLENPSWYTAYTPYQPEISQGRLEALLTFQTLISDLTALPVANASLLDEATAAAEAMTLLRRSSRAGKDAVFVVDADIFDATYAVLQTRAQPLDIKLRKVDTTRGLPDEDIFGVLLQYPGASGEIRDHTALITDAHERGALVAVAADLLSLTLLTPPGEMGADAVVGSAQRFGVPLGFGGPHAGYMSVTEKLQRRLPGRLVGMSVDTAGKPAYRLALQTREQHIRREKATSNICTAQVLLAVIAAMYASWHGPDGLRCIAERTHRHAAVLASGLRAGGIEVVSESFFDTLTVSVPLRAREIVDAAHAEGVNLHYVNADRVSISTDETTTPEHLRAVWRAFGVSVDDLDSLDRSTQDSLTLHRSTQFLTHPVFSSYHSETAMMRYLRTLAAKDYALDRGMIPLGSCTMKLNAASEMEPISYPGFAEIHPYAPEDQTRGYRRLISRLEEWLASVTGYDAVSVQPNAGSQGELAGLLAIRMYHAERGEKHRDICLIPVSAHGTNAASAVMAGMRVVGIACDDNGNVDLADLRSKIAEHRDTLAALMVTYPSTHGVYETQITQVCSMVHDAGGQVYVDGANLNALVGFSQPGHFGADVSHLNLHKTFCIPHGGGGPGVGPVAVREHLAPYLPNHPLRADAGPETGCGAISAAPFGSAGILPISWAFVRMMGAEGLTAATQAAVVSANYIAARLAEHYPILYKGDNGLIAHECIVDIRPLTKQSGVSAEDIAKRLMDYGFHAPTMAFPVAGTLMVEPTESEPLEEIDRFIDAMIAMKAEADRVSAGEWPVDDNPLVNAPHTAETLAGEWSHAYSRREAVFPEGVDPATKYWPPVARVDNAHGDRNFCGCW